MLTINGNPGDSTLIVRGPTDADAAFTLESHERQTLVTPGSVETLTINDAEIERTSPAIVDYGAELSAYETVAGTLTPYLTYKSLTPDIASVDASGVVTRISDGTAKIAAHTRLTSRLASIQVWRDSEAVYDALLAYVAGSVARDAADAIDNAIAGRDPSIAKPLYNVYGELRNVNNWAALAGYDLTGCSPWNSRGGNKRAGTAIARDIIICSEHYALLVGTTVYFVAADGTIVTRTVVAVANVGLPNASDGYETDLQVCRLDSDLPESIAHYKVLPGDWADYLPSLNSEYRVPCLVLDQEEKALVSDLSGLTDWASFRSPIDSQRVSFYESIIDGDSGNPAFAVIGGELVLLTCWTFGGSGRGPNLAILADQINAAMTAAGSAYAVETIDLRLHTNYADGLALAVQGDKLDHSANGTTVTEVGSVSSGEFLTYDDRNDRLVMPNQFDSAITAYTLSAWFRLDNLPAGGTRGIISTCSAIYTWYGLLGITAAIYNGNWRVLLFHPRANDTVSYRYFWLAADDETTWHHAASTWDGTAFRVFFDGEQFDETGESTIATMVSDTYIGTVSYAPSSYGWFGDLDDVEIYRNRALSAEEIAEQFAINRRKYGI